MFSNSNHSNSLQGEQDSCEQRIYSCRVCKNFQRSLHPWDTPERLISSCGEPPSACLCVRHFGSILLARVQDQNQRKMKYAAEAKQVEDILNFTCAFVFPSRVLFFDGPNINSGTFFLSINRFERKKNLELALKAFAHFRLSPRKCAADRVMLVLAGGFDKRLKENVEYFKQLKR